MALARSHSTKNGSTGLYEVLLTEMYKRPAAVTIVGGLLVFFGIKTMLECLFHWSDDEPSWMSNTQYANFKVGLIVEAIIALVNFISGVFMFREANWARWLYTGTWATVLVAELIFLHDHFGSLIFGNIMRFFLVIPLFLPDSNDYFAPDDRDRW